MMLIAGAARERKKRIIRCISQPESSRAEGLPAERIFYERQGRRRSVRRARGTRLDGLGVKNREKGIVGGGKKKNSAMSAGPEGAGRRGGRGAVSRVPARIATSPPSCTKKNRQLKTKTGSLSAQEKKVTGSEQAGKGGWKACPSGEQAWRKEGVSRKTPRDGTRGSPAVILFSLSWKAQERRPPPSPGFIIGVVLLPRYSGGGRDSPEKKRKILTQLKRRGQPTDGARSRGGNAKHSKGG